MSNWFDFVQQHREAVSGNSGFVPVVEDVLVEIKGADAGKLLQGQVTADVDKLVEGAFTPSALCTNKGRVVSTFHLFRNKQSFYCRLPADNAEQLITTLKKYAVFYQVEIGLREDIGIVVLKDSVLSEELSDKALLLQHGEHIREYWIEHADWQDCFEFLASEGPRNAGLNWQLAKIEMGWPEIHQNTAEGFLPHALSLDLADAISFSKGCYTGQEIVARTQYRGKSKKRLARFQVSAGSILPGAEIKSVEGAMLGAVVVAEDVTAEASEMLASVMVDLPETGEFLVENILAQYGRLPLPWDAN